jgi:hypothetical protein
MDKLNLTRRKILSAVGAVGAAIGGAGLITEPSLTYAATTTVEVESGTLEVDWRETYNGNVLEDTRSSTYTQDGAVISLGNVLPGDVGTVSFRLRNPQSANSAVTPELSLNLLGTAENGIIDPEAEAGDTTGGADEGELQEYLDATLWYDEGLMTFDILGGDNATREMGESLITSGADGTLADVASAVDDTRLNELSPGEEVTVAFRWEFTDERNIGVTQTDSVTFAFNLGGS